MFRNSIRISLFRGTSLGMNSFSQRFVPPFMSKNSHKESREGTGSSSSGGPSQDLPNLQRQLVSVASARPSSVMSLRSSSSTISQDYQDVRDRGPLFNFAKTELDSNPEHARQQWRDLCVEQQEKQKIANDLWEENNKLQARCKNVEADNKRIRAQLATADQARKSLEQDVRWLEVNNERTKEALAAVTQSWKCVFTNYENLSADVRRTKGTIRELGQVREEQRDELASWEAWDEMQKRTCSFWANFALGMAPWVAFGPIFYLVFHDKF